ncbi:MAG: SDR family oxidoreductase, partial [Chloroflexota bacterium]
MILVVGASGRLGGSVARLLLARGTSVRVMTRSPERVDNLIRLGAEVVLADLREPTSLRQALRGVDTVFAAAHGYPGEDDNNPHTVDDLGMRCLIAMARATGAARFVFTSALGARADHPVDFLRIKHGIEKYLRGSILGYTILRPASFMESWVELIAGQIVERGEYAIVGRGDNPINFVAVDDVARLAALVLDNPGSRGEVIEFGGPENLTLRQMATTIQEAVGGEARARQIPVPVARALAVVYRLINPTLGRQIAAGVNLATADLTFDPTETLRRFPV